MMLMNASLKVTCTHVAVLETLGQLAPIDFMSDI